ncbi:MAG: ABC transporter permease [Deltaproteobacteria bacterium]|jgi:ABC-type lipoprotein release transport system permease subunit|nr:ABC transporter permease [Deltaproteobacteria bacterium]MBW2512511.1 ABC transporter permease [Deltaproteobacteria bacterium]MDH4007087.1 FtsX-like permease family protein [Desulfuromonadales bacterium]
MDLVRLSWKNIWRNRRRTIITLTAIAFSIMLVQALHNLSFGVYAGMVDSGVRAGSGHIAVYRNNYLESRDETLYFKDGSLVDDISQINGVEQVLPRLYIPALAQSSRESRGVMLIGVDPDRERQVNPFLKTLPADGMIRSTDSRDAVVGTRLLHELQIRPGQKFVVTAQNEDGTLHSELLRVRGVVNSGMKDIDSSLILVGLGRATQLTGNSGSVHELAVILADAGLEATVHRQIAAQFAQGQDILAVSWEEAMPNLANAIKLDYASQKFIFMIILLIVAIGVINTLLMSVMERMREFGVILAMGSRPMTLRCMIMLEAVILGLLAAAIGTVLGSLATWYLVAVGIDLADLVPETLEFGGVVFDPVMRASWDPAWMLRIAVYVVCLTLLAAAYPAIKAGRTTPVEGMRHH